MTVSNNAAAFVCCALCCPCGVADVGCGLVGAFGSYTASPLRPAPTLSVRPDGV